MLALLVAAVAAAGSPAGFSLDAGANGQSVDASDDAGSHAEERVAPRVNVRIVGAQVMPAEAYLDMLRLPDVARPDAVTAAAVQAQLLAYLQRTGFQLASVGVIVEDGDLVVHLNEGQIERLIYPGQLSFQQVRFKLALSLPGDVFNRLMLDRQVRELAEQMQLDGVTWELVRTSAVAHSGPQVDELPTAIDMSVQGAQLVHARRPYEVRIRFPNNENGTGLGLSIKSGSVDGLETGLGNRWASLFFEGDRFFMAGSGGFGVRMRLETEKLYFSFTRALTEVRYDSPQLLHRLRPNVWLQNVWLARQRADLHLENYWAMTAAAALQLELELKPGLHVLVGAGFEWRRIFGLQAQTGYELPASVAARQVVDRKRPFLRLTLEWVVDPEIMRWDKRHLLEGEARSYLTLPTEPGFGWLDLRYQYVKGFGWHDFWVKSRGRVSWGDVTFHDELSIGELTRGLFSNQFTPSAINLSLEFRFSITRDSVKVGLFHDLVLFAMPVRELGTLVPEVANAFGPGFHLLLHDMFQLDAYVAFGFRRGAPLGAAFNLQLQKAF